MAGLPIASVTVRADCGGPVVTRWRSNWDVGLTLLVVAFFAGSWLLAGFGILAWLFTDRPRRICDGRGRMNPDTTAIDVPTFACR